MSEKPIEERIELAVANGYRQGDVAMLYARAIRQLDPRSETWTRINDAITARWPKGLDRVKKLAWQIVEAA